MISLPLIAVGMLSAPAVQPMGYQVLQAMPLHFLVLPVKVEVAQMRVSHRVGTDPVPRIQ